MRPDERRTDHVDEGAVHAWLDGALSAGEGALIEEHVTACSTCAALVAEARGLIAASSRILVALDDVPGDVIPSTRPASVPPSRPIPVAFANDVPASAPPALPIETAVTPLRRPVRRAVPWMRSSAFRAAAAIVVMAGGAFVVTSRAGFDRSAPSPAIDAGREAAPDAVPAPALGSTPAGDANREVVATPTAPPRDDARARDLTERETSSAQPPQRAGGPADRRASAPAASMPAPAPSAEPPATARARVTAPAAKVAPPPATNAADAALAQTRVAEGARGAATAGGTIAGRVTDTRGAPLAGVRVEMVIPPGAGAAARSVAAGRGAGTVTDSAGRFVLADVVPGAATVRARGLGFAPTATTVGVAPAETTRATLALAPSALHLSEVVVTNAPVATSAAPAPTEARRDAAGRSDALKRVAPDDAVPGCYRLSVGDWAPSGMTDSALPATLRLDRPPTATAPWTLATNGVLTVRRGAVTLTLRARDGGWDGDATSGVRRAPVRLVRETTSAACAAPAR